MLATWVVEGSGLSRANGAPSISIRCAYDLIGATALRLAVDVSSETRRARWPLSSSSSRVGAATVTVVRSPSIGGTKLATSGRPRRESVGAGEP